MKSPQAIPPLLAILLAMASAAPADEAEPSIIRFASPNRDQLTGSLESIGEDRLVWRSPLLARPTPFFLKDVLELTLPTVIPKSDADHEATLTLEPQPEDEAPPRIKGQLVAVTDDKVILDTWYAGRMEFRRSMIKSVDIEDRASLVFSGPTGLDGWIQPAKGKPAWTFDRGSLRITSAAGTTTGKPIGRNLELPESCSVRFDVAWSGSLYLGLNLFTDAEDPSPSRGYYLACQSGFMMISRLNSMMGGGGDHFGVPEFRENEKVNIEVRANRRTGDVALYVNGRIITNWKDAEGGKGKFDGGIQFSSITQSGDTRQELAISKIKIATWDGVLENAPPGNMGMVLGGWRGGGQGDVKPEPKKEDSETAADSGRMKLRNGDSIAGEVTAITDGVMHVKTPFAEVKLPVARVRNIMLKPADLERPIRRNGDVRAWFPDGVSIVFHLDSLGKDTITGSSQTFGRAEFKLAAFNRIDFNIHDPRITDLRANEKP